MQEAQSGFVRLSHRRCQDCDIREDLHASGKPNPKRRHRIARCEPCKGLGEIPLDLKAGIDPYRGKTPAGRPQFYEAKRAQRAYAERHRFRPKTRLFELCEVLMQIPPTGFNHGRTKDADERSGWRTLESHGMDGEVFWHPSFKRISEAKPIKHGTRYAYQRRKCRCFLCRRWAADDRQKQRLRPVS